MSGVYEYRTILMPGLYTLAFTCRGTADDDTNQDVGAIALVPPTGGNPLRSPART